MAWFLVIEDDNSIRQLMAATLEKAGHEVAQAATGAEGAVRFKERRPDVVITDIIMPEDSIETIVELKMEYPNVPYVVVSGLSAQSARSLEVARLLDARRMVAKPFRLPDFLGVIDSVLAELNLPQPTVCRIP